MHTEEDARKLWCPFARVAVGGGEMLGNRYPMDTDYSEKSAFATCIASDCMAWRYWVPDPATYEDGKAPGYCGLAGKPE